MKFISDVNLLIEQNNSFIEDLFLIKDLKRNEKTRFEDLRDSKNCGLVFKRVVQFPELFLPSQPLCVRLTDKMFTKKSICMFSTF